MIPGSTSEDTVGAGVTTADFVSFFFFAIIVEWRKTHSTKYKKCLSILCNQKRSFLKPLFLAFSCIALISFYYKHLWHYETSVTLDIFQA